MSKPSIVSSTCSSYSVESYSKATIYVPNMGEKKAINLLPAGQARSRAHLAGWVITLYDLPVKNG
ncbi:MAG TPA: hypothetical protein PJ988_02485, partial [Anaerolinea sp.]|nr:hypothetical protein [Anaerolinea sp.]